MEIRRGTSDDATALTEIAFAAKRYWGYPEKWIESWRPLLTIEPAFIANHATYVATVGDRPVGFYALTEEVGRIELQHIWVLPEFMGQGIGRLLFNDALRRAKDSGFHELEIESDPNAVGFYERMGARRVGARLVELDQQRRELPVLVCPVDPII